MERSRLAPPSAAAAADSCGLVRLPGTPDRLSPPQKRRRRLQDTAAKKEREQIEKCVEDIVRQKQQAAAGELAKFIEDVVNRKLQEAWSAGPAPWLWQAAGAATADLRPASLNPFAAEFAPERGLRSTSSEAAVQTTVSGEELSLCARELDELRAKHELLVEAAAASRASLEALERTLREAALEEFVEPDTDGRGAGPHGRYVRCHVCRDVGDQLSIIFCEGCAAAVHERCVADDAWQEHGPGMWCPQCRVEQPNSDSESSDEEESEEEEEEKKYSLAEVEALFRDKAADLVREYLAKGRPP